MNGYNPAGPYVFKTGKHQNQSVEVLMFRKYGFLRWLLNKISQESNGGTKNLLHRHLEWLLARGEELNPTAICPHCKLRPVEYFSIRRSGNDFNIGTYYTCCGNLECREKLVALSWEKFPEFKPFKFSVIAEFEKGDQKRVGELFRWAFGLPKPLKRETVFTFFNANAA